MSDNTFNYHEYVQVLGLEDVFDSKRAINEAFYFAKNSSPVSLLYHKLKNKSFR